jgi:hypothetical protein
MAGIYEICLREGSYVMICTYIRSFINIGSGIQKLLEGGIHGHRQHEDRINPLLFFKIRKVRLTKKKNQNGGVLVNTDVMTGRETRCAGGCEHRSLIYSFLEYNRFCIARANALLALLNVWRNEFVSAVYCSVWHECWSSKYSWMSCIEHPL